MNLQIFTDDALEIIKLGEMSPEEMVRYQREHSDDVVATVKAIIGSYAGELILAASVAEVPLDLSYDTIKNIPASLSMLYKLQQKQGFIDSRNKIVICRTLAAYISLLIINNFDGCSIDANVHANKRNTTRPEMWAERIVMKLDKKKNSDLLPYVWEGANMADKDEEKIENGFVLKIKPLVDEYKDLTGDDLTDEGLTDMTLTHEGEEKGEQKYGLE